MLAGRATKVSQEKVYSCIVWIMFLLILEHDSFDVEKLFKVLLEYAFYCLSQACKPWVWLGGTCCFIAQIRDC